MGRNQNMNGNLHINFNQVEKKLERLDSDPRHENSREGKTSMQATNDMRGISVNNFNFSKDRL